MGCRIPLDPPANTYPSVLRHMLGSMLQRANKHKQLSCCYSLLFWSRFTVILLHCDELECLLPVDWMHVLLMVFLFVFELCSELV